jgi:hypothetical protein
VNGRLSFERGVAASPVEKHFNVSEQVAHRGLARGGTRTVHSVVLQAVEEALARRARQAIRTCDKSTRIEVYDNRTRMHE